MNSITLLLILVASLLALSSLITYVMQKRSSKDLTELRSRVRSWWVMAAIFFSMILAGKAAALILLATISYLALKEYFTMIPIRQVDRRIIFWSYLAIVPQFWWAYIEWYEMFIIWIPVYVFLLLPFRQVLTGRTDGFVESTGKVQWGLMLFVFSISHLAFLYTLPERNGATGVEMLLFLVVLTELNDIFQYLFGKRFGKRRIVPTVSPNKSVEGFAGAVAVTPIAAAALGFLTPFTLFETLFAGLIIAVAGFIGDVVVSMIKRDVGIKDSGTLIPGHGGILDRIDSLTYTAPLFFHYVYYLYY